MGEQGGERGGGGRKTEREGRERVCVCVQSVGVERQKDKRKHKYRLPNTCLGPANVFPRKQWKNSRSSILIAPGEKKNLPNL